MYQSQKDDSSLPPPLNPLPDSIEMIGELAESLLEELEQDRQSEKEPFEHYATEVRLRLCQDTKAFQKQLVEGYKVLLETLDANF